MRLHTWYWLATIWRIPHCSRGWCLGLVGLLVVTSVAVPDSSQNTETLTAPEASQRASTPPAESFEVTSIRPRESPAFRAALIAAFPGGRFEASNATVTDLVRYAYGIPRLQIVQGGPAWARTDRFEISAKAEQYPGPPVAGEVGPIQRMVQRLLADRFNLTIHWEPRTQAGYALVLSRSDGRLGPGLRPSKLDCVAEETARVARMLAGEKPETPESLSGKCNVVTTNGRMQADGQTMSRFAQVIQLRLQSQRGADASVPVVDRTGLTGPFSIEMTAQPSFVPPRAQAELLAAGKSLEDFGPPLDVALREQLGLKLEPTQVDVRVIVIDRVERPTPN